MNLNTLQPGNVNHTLTKEEMSKGGKEKSIAKSLINRKRCNEGCPIFYQCPVQYASTIYFKEPGKGSMCALKKLPIGAQVRIENIFMKGREGLIAEMKKCVLLMSFEADKLNTLKGHAMYLHALMKLHRLFYGQKIKKVYV